MIYRFPLFFEKIILSYQECSFKRDFGGMEWQLDLIILKIRKVTDHSPIKQISGSLI